MKKINTVQCSECGGLKHQEIELNEGMVVHILHGNLWSHGYIASIIEVNENEFAVIKVYGHGDKAYNTKSFYKDKNHELCVNLYEYIKERS